MDELRKELVARINVKRAEDQIKMAEYVPRMAAAIVEKIRVTAPDEWQVSGSRAELKLTWEPLLYGVATLAKVNRWLGRGFDVVEHGAGGLCIFFYAPKQ